MHKQAFIINFHGIGAAPRPHEPGEQPFWISRQEFLGILDLVQSKAHEIALQLSFDDGNSSDYEIAAPELCKRGLNAVFFVLAGKFGLPGYLTRSQVRELVENGFRIGSHGLNHVDWSCVDDDELARELSESRSILEEIIGHEVTWAAIPFGSYDRRVLSALKRSGYQRVYSSDGRTRLSTAWPTPRYSVRTGIRIDHLADMVGSETTINRLQNEVRLRIKALLFRSTVRRLIR